MEVNLEIKQGYSYHIKDSFFSNVQDASLMSNKDDGNYRPHYYAVKDSKNADIFWMIPISSKVEKYKKIQNHKIKKSGKCITIVIGLFAGKERAFLIQNAFPINAAYLDHIHTISGSPVTIHKSLDNELRTKLKEAIAIMKNGKKIFYADIAKILEIIRR
ncbi:hypothetical protein GCWU000282_00812 [Catonella morbi ATCC 51271]|uniref:Uncharacterized protein n=1 Tax=Catonella morbi ATCC 51271 TaxID=592026 RepID=V2Y6E3_9FIRM|nr:hypothetical protein GCWU000282_00812 [Catonella morbi ATCC 51271]